MMTAHKHIVKGGGKYYGSKKWREFLSIGLLIFALVLILGIVAWAFTIEVFNSYPNRNNNNHHHNHHHHHPHNNHFHHRRQLAKESEQKFSSALLLTNLDQVEALKRSAPTTAAPIHRITKKRILSSANNEDNSKSSVVAGQNLDSDSDSSDYSADRHQQQHPTPDNVTPTSSTSTTSTTTTTTTTTTTPPPPTTTTTMTPRKQQLLSGELVKSIKIRDKDNNAKNRISNVELDADSESGLDSDSGSVSVSVSEPSVATRNNRYLILDRNFLAKLSKGSQSRSKKLIRNQNYDSVEFGNNDEPKNANKQGEREESSLDSLLANDEPTNESQENSESISVAEREGRAAKFAGADSSPAEVSENEKYQVQADSNNHQSSSGKQDSETEKQEQQKDEDLGFEAIASAISTSLSESSHGLAQHGEPQTRTHALTQVQTKAEVEASPLEGDTGSLDQSADEVDELAASIASEPNGSASSSASERASRKRTTGEHVAEVIDHIVERRKLASRRTMRGPQVVVVAPVGGDPNLMKARSLVREQPSNSTTETKSVTKHDSITSSSKTLALSTPATSMKTNDYDKSFAKKPQANLASVVEDKRVTSTIKKEAIIALNEAKKSKYNKPTTRKALGARLLGSDDSLEANKMNGEKVKYSERVEVIEDDDSSAFLLKAPASSDKQDEDEQDFNPDHEEVEEREHERQQQKEIADLLGDQLDGSIHISSHSGEPRSRSPRHELNPGQTFERFQSLPTVMTRPIQQQADAQALHYQYQQLQQQLLQSTQAPRLYSAEQLIREHVMKSRMKQAPPLGSVSESVTAKTIDAQVSGVANQHSTVNQQQQIPEQQQQQLQTSDRQIKVIPTTIRPHPTTPESTTVAPAAGEQVNNNRQQQQQPSMSGVDYSASYQSIKVPLFSVNPQSQHQNQVASPMRQPVDPYQVSESQQSQQSQRVYIHDERAQQQPHQQIAQQPQSVESQKQATQTQHQQQQQQVVNSLPQFADQEFNVPAHMAESVIQNIQGSPPSYSMVNGQPAVISSASGQVPQPNHYLSHQAFPHQHLQANNQQQAWQQQQQLQVNQMLARLAAEQQQQSLHYLQHPSINQHQPQFYQHSHSNQPQQQSQQRQMMADRDSSAEQSASKSSSTVPRGLIHPVAQMALKHLLSSLGQQAAQQQQQLEQSSQARSMAAASSPVEQPGRSMRSLPIGGSPSSMMAAASAAGPSSSGVDQSSRSSAPLVQDQEVQESYGQMPTYHMGGGGYGGGDHYQSEHDKKSKGITFHFGGGPIGGGTQLITSPMGIFKHLMIPLLPNPRVNLNGKVVFGVVLEKSTAFGEPKKRYKFWGR